MVGYIYGGIESTQPNIFFSNTGTQSWSSSKIFEVYIDPSKPQSATNTQKLNTIGFKAFSNQEDIILQLKNLTNHQEYEVKLFHISGKKVFEDLLLPNETNEINFSKQPNWHGWYIISLQNGQLNLTQKIYLR